MEKKYKIGYTTGVYDMFHIGHLNILRRAKEQCETLIVGVTTDELCYKRKQKYPIINEQERMAIVESIRYVDKVVPQADMEKIRPVKELGADAVFVGSDWKGTDAWIQYEKEFAEVGCSVVYLDHTDGISSTYLRDKLTKITPQKTDKKIIGYTQGVYDLFHIGHLNLIRHAKEQCDILYVGVNSDDLVQSYKNKRPVKNDIERAAIIHSIEEVNGCVIVDTLDKNEIWNKVHFDKIFIGSDWKGNERWLKTEKDLENVGAKVIYLPHTDGICTTMLRNKL